jgi:proteasome accessory factor C
MTSSDQLRRILHLIPALADGEPHRIQDLVWDVGINRSLLLHDLESITERFEVPGGFVEGLQIFIDADTISVVPNHFLRPMRLTKGELCALELGLSMLRAERPYEEHLAIDMARHRLESVIAKLPDEEIAGDLRYATLSAAGDLEHLRRLREAFRQRRRVRLRYRKAAEERASVRVICPYGIVFASGMWYAIAHCDGADELRIYRLDRIEAVEQLDTKFTAPRDGRPLGGLVDSMLREGRVFQAAAETLRVRYSPRIARWIAEREGKGLDPDGSLTMEHPLGDTEWAVRHLLQYGPEVEVIEPDVVKTELQLRLKAMESLV